MFAPVRSLLSWIAPLISRTLLFLVKLPAALIALVLEAAQLALGRLRAGLRATAAAADALARALSPARAFLAIGAAAAIGLGISQFFDYHGVAVDAPEYSGEVGSVAPAPLTDTVNAGGAHLYLLLAVAIAALALIVAVSRGRKDLARWVAICGLIGVAVSLAIDLPQGLDAGRPGLAFSGAEAQLLQGFWAQLSASAVLLLCGGLLMLELGRAPSHEQSRSSGGSERIAPEVGKVTPGWQGGS